MYSIAIVVVAYSRPDETRRLLDSLLRAEYDENKVDLVISIDKGKRQSEIVDLANTIDWPYGQKYVRVFDERLGLRPHIIQCGNLTEKYDAVVVLEDDITVSKYYYQYLRLCIPFYENDDRISGISLYSYEVNHYAHRPFQPAYNGYDTYLMQVTVSWGQCWTRSMWESFIKWYETHNTFIIEDEKIPQEVVNWDNKSWVKFFDRYIIDTNKYFVMPYFSLSTNNSEAGEHFKNKDSSFQVPLLEGIKDYRFATFDEAIKYDAFFERMEIDDKLFPDLQGEKLLDLNGIRTHFGSFKYLISTQDLNYKVVKKVALSKRPQENSCLYPEKGNGIYIYDLECTQKGPRGNLYCVAKYDLRDMSWHNTLRHATVTIFNSIKSKIFRK